MKIVPTTNVLGAQVQEIDLSRPLDQTQVDQLILALGKHGVLEFPNQNLTTVGLKVFSQNFGDLWVSPGACSGC